MTGAGATAPSESQKHTSAGKFRKLKKINHRNDGNNFKKSSDVLFMNTALAATRAEWLKTNGILMIIDGSEREIQLFSKS